MKISSNQVQAAIAAYIRARHTRSQQQSEQSASPPVDGLQNRLSELPEERDILVHNLRAKVRRGRYFVSSREIVSALLGRLAADLLHHD